MFLSFVPECMESVTGDLKNISEMRDERDTESSTLQAIVSPK